MCKRGMLGYSVFHLIGQCWTLICKEKRKIISEIHGINITWICRLVRERANVAWKLERIHTSANTNTNTNTDRIDIRNTRHRHHLNIYVDGGEREQMLAAVELQPLLSPQLLVIQPTCSQLAISNIWKLYLSFELWRALYLQAWGKSIILSNWNRCWVHSC